MRARIDKAPVQEADSRRAQVPGLHHISCHGPARMAHLHDQPRLPLVDEPLIDAAIVAGETSRRVVKLRQNLLLLLSREAQRIDARLLGLLMSVRYHILLRRGRCPFLHRSYSASTRAE